MCIFEFGNDTPAIKKPTNFKCHLWHQTVQWQTIIAFILISQPEKKTLQKKVKREK